MTILKLNYPCFFWLILDMVWMETKDSAGRYLIKAR